MPPAKKNYEILRKGREYSCVSDVSHHSFMILSLQRYVQVKAILNASWLALSSEDVHPILRIPVQARIKNFLLFHAEP